MVGSKCKTLNIMSLCQNLESFWWHVVEQPPMLFAIFQKIWVPINSYRSIDSKKSSSEQSAHIGNCFVHAREQIDSKFAYLEFHIWKLLGNELNFQTVSNCVNWACTEIAYPLHTNLILWKLYLHTTCIPCIYHVIYS